MVATELWIDHRDLAELARDVLNQGQYFRFRAHGQSMWPFIRPGDVLLIEPLRSKWPRVGDVALYQTVHGTLVAHRVVRTGARESENNSGLYLRGDRLWAPLEQTHPHQLLGRVVAIERDHHWISLTVTRHRLTVLTWLALRPTIRVVRRHLSALKRFILSVGQVTVRGQCFRIWIYGFINCIKFKHILPNRQV